MKELWVEIRSTHKYFKGVYYAEGRMEQRN